MVSSGDSWVISFQEARQEQKNNPIISSLTLDEVAALAGQSETSTVSHKGPNIVSHKEASHGCIT